jgi:hypothetical protein
MTDERIREMEHAAATAALWQDVRHVIIKIIAISLIGGLIGLVIGASVDRARRQFEAYVKRVAHE